MIQVYHGDGKGKTTAAAGLALRALGNKKQVVFVQFLKARPSGEITILSRLPGITVLRNETDYGFYKKMTDEQKQRVAESHNQNIERTFGLLGEGKCDLLVLDEAASAYNYGLLDRGRIRELLALAEKGSFELVVTGRNPDEIFLEKADYITQMRKERHPFDKGVAARKGIEY